MLVLKELVGALLGRRRKRERATERAASPGVDCRVGEEGSAAWAAGLAAGSAHWGGGETGSVSSMVDVA
jgi:hypothetical protein